MGKLGGVYYKPLMTNFYALIWNLFGENPAAFRIPLWFLHVASAAMIALLGSLYLPLTLAYLWGFLFLLHPINSEVLFYLADAQDILYLFFGLFALVILQFCKNTKFALFSCLLALAAAFFSKETGVLFLFIAPVYSFCFVKNKFRALVVGTFALFTTYILIRFSVGLTVIRSSWLHISEASFLERLQMLPWILGHYIEILFFPMRLSLAHDVRLGQVPIFINTNQTVVEFCKKKSAMALAVYDVLPKFLIKFPYNRRLLNLNEAIRTVQQR